MAHAFDPNTPEVEAEAETGGSLESEANLVYIVSFRIARAT